jgi:uncharacterized membrane protein
MLCFDSVLFKRMLQVMEETRAMASELKQDVASIKMLLSDSRGASSMDYSETISYLDNPMETEIQLQEFCKKLSENRPFRRQVVKSDLTSQYIHC